MPRLAMKRFQVLGSAVLGSVVLLVRCFLAAQSPQALLNRAVDEFEQGRFAAVCCLI